jgi:hypothetical protein
MKLLPMNTMVGAADGFCPADGLTSCAPNPGESQTKIDAITAVKTDRWEAGD